MIKKSVSQKILSLVSMAFVPLLFGFYSIILGQDINWDLKNYHLYNPYSYIHNRIQIDLAPAGQQSYFNPILDLAYFSILSTLSPKAVGFTIGVIQGFSFIFICKIAEQILGKTNYFYILFLGIAGLLSVGFLSEVGRTLHDSLVGVLSLASLWLAILAFAIRNLGINNQSRSFLLIATSGTLMGVACGLKLVFAIYALALLIGLVLIPVPWGVRFKLTLLFGVCAFVGLLLTSGYWHYKMWVEFGNPTFPLYNNIFHGEFASAVSHKDARFLPKNFYEKVFYPVIFTNDPLRVGELHYRQVSWIFGYVALLALGYAGIFRSSKMGLATKLSPQAILLVSYFGISYVLWLNTFGIYRYLIPIEVLIPLLIFVAIDHFFMPHVPRWGVIIFLSLITLANLRGVPDWGRSNWGDSVYRVEQSVLTVPPEPAAVYLVGQPLAWIIPALEINSPFIQLLPNMSVTNAYFRRARNLAEGRDGKQYAIFESSSLDLASLASISLAKLGLALDESACHRLVGYLGTARHEYRYCEVRKQNFGSKFFDE